MTSKLDDLYLCYQDHFGLANSSPSDEFYNSLEFRDFVYRANQLGSVLLPLQEVFCAISALVSGANIFILTRPPMSSSSLNFLLVVLECVNLTSAVVQMYFFFIYMLYGFLTSSYALYVSQLVAIGLDDNAVYFTNWLTVAIASWRLVAITNPIKATYILKRRKAIAVLCFISLNVCLNVCFYYLAHSVEKHWIYVCSDLENVNATMRPMYHWDTSSWASNNEYLFEIIQAAILIMNFVIPCGIFAVLNISLIYTIFRSKKKRDSLREGQLKLTSNDASVRSTIILIIYLWMFLACSSFMATTELHLLFCSRDLVDKAVTICVQYLPNCIANSTSFLVYYFMCSKFRMTCKEIVRGISKRFRRVHRDDSLAIVSQRRKAYSADDYMLF